MNEFDLAVIGAGPGGYVAAIRAAQLGLKVAVVEKETTFGGTCVRVGCIPSKALLESSHRYSETVAGLAEHGISVRDVELDLEQMQARKQAIVKSNTDGVAYLFRKNGITSFTGTGRITEPGRVSVDGADGSQELQATNILIATGSSVQPLRGVEFDGELIVSSSEALEWDSVPEQLIVVGAGAIGLELGSVWQRLGAQVTVIEYLDRVLPGMDLEISREAQKLLSRQGLEFRLSSAVSGASVEDGRVTVSLDGGEELSCDRLLVAVGRRPNTEGLGLQELGVELDAQGRIGVDAQFRTNVPGVLAIGDVIAGPMLAHKAEEDGVAAVEFLAGQKPQVDYGLVPSIVYTAPEVAMVGATEEQLKEQGVPYRSGSFPFSANGRARTAGTTEGKVKLLAHADSDRLLGVHIIGAHAGDLIAEAVAAMAFGASAEDIALTVHAHPTLAEALREAALALHGRALHI